MKQVIKKSPILPWILVFIVASIIFRENGGTNEMSRYATLRAMSDHLSFQINDYQDWTIDWSIKDGRIFSNKAPGPMLLGFPAFLILDQFSKFDKKDIKAKNGSRTRPVSSTPRVLMALLYQVLPYSLLLIIICNWIQTSTSLPSLAIHFLALACLFGNTASLFMNFFFGHGMAAYFVLGLSFYLYKKKYFLVGLFFGLTLLCEYSSALLLPALIIALFLQRSSMKKSDLLSILKGGIAPGLLWCLYHYQTVGSIFKITAQFQNPKWIDSSVNSKKLWGMFSLPDPHVFFKLLFGFERGILWTQPWVFISWALGLQTLSDSQASDSKKSLSLFVLLSTLFLLFMNSAFNGWHGGVTSGPRYLSMIFPASALLIALNFDSLKTKMLSYLLYFSLGLSLLFRILVYGGRALAPENYNLWPWLFQDLLDKPGMRGELRAFSLILMLCIAGYRVYKKQFSKLN
ncbi:MAG: hypothetical protein HN576_03675 [Bacteriovoracaceae bacterium]|jgi:hypothetical protein|nr:hypothetical protein [Bacteriovoracaceae bacterium]